MWCLSAFYRKSCHLLLLLRWIRIYSIALDDTVNEAMKRRKSSWGYLTIQYTIGKASVTITSCVCDRGELMEEATIRVLYN